MSDDSDDAARPRGAAARGDAGDGDPGGRARPPWGILALAVVFALSALTVLFAPVRWLAFPAALPGIDPGAPEHQRAIVAVIAAQVDDPVGDFPGVGVGDTGQDPGGDAAAGGEVPADDPAAGGDGVGGPGRDPRVAPEDAAPEDPPADPAGADRAHAAAGRAARDPDAAAVFVSWVLAQAGLPLRDDAPPPGAPWAATSVPELRELLRARGAFTDDDLYMPQVGDVVLFDGPGPVGDDARIVVGVLDRDITVAGFRDGEVAVHSMGLRGRSGILGFGMTAVLADQRELADAAASDAAAGTAGAASAVPGDDAAG